jgi:pimeloyl-ACP methyl ester carboxylesterase
MLHEYVSNTGNLALNYARTDNHNAQPLLCLHGVTRSWQTFLPLIPTLALRWQVYALDQRGHGRSGRAKSYFAIDYVPDTVHFLRDEIKRPTVVYGHSLGAMVAIAVAAEATDLVRAVILEDPPFDTMGARIKSYPLYPYFLAVESLAGNAMEITQLVEKLGAIEIDSPRGKIALRNVRDASALRFTAKCLQQLDPAVMRPIVESQWLKGYDLQKTAGRIKSPALVIQADGDAGGMLTDEDADLLERMIADITRVRVSGIGHQIHTTAPDAALRIALGFLESLQK